MHIEKGRLLYILALSALPLACGGKTGGPLDSDGGQTTVQGSTAMPGQGTVGTAAEGNPAANNASSQPTDMSSSDLGSSGSNNNQGMSPGQGGGAAPDQGGVVATSDGGTDATDDVPADVPNTDGVQPEGQAGTPSVGPDSGPGQEEGSGEESKKPSWAGCPGRQPKVGADCSAEMTNTCYYGDVTCVCEQELWVCTDANGVPVSEEDESGNGRSDAGGVRRGRQSDAGRSSEDDSSGSQEGRDASSRGPRNGG